jgi:organic hydroperoxide reductase OsmC/OhrA
MTFATRVLWSGAVHGSTRENATFSRDLEVTLSSGPLPASSAPAFRGDPSRANPEELFVASIASCQALTYLFLAARGNIGVIAYEDEAHGELQQIDGRMRMARVILRPRILIDDGASESRARELVFKAHAGCFIANSVTAQVDIEPHIAVAGQLAPAAAGGA